MIDVELWRMQCGDVEGGSFVCICLCIVLQAWRPPLPHGNDGGGLCGHRARDLRTVYRRGEKSLRVDRCGRTNTEQM